MLDIFAPEISALDSELIQLQTLLETKRKEQSLLKELGFEANSTITAIAKLKEKVQAVKGEAIAALKSAVLNLFIDGDDGGNQPTDDPIPEPEPVDDDFDILALNGETGEFLTTDDLQEDDSQEQKESEEPQDELEESQEEEESEDEEPEERLYKDAGKGGLIYHPDNSAIAWIASDSEDGKLTTIIGFQKKAIARSWQPHCEFILWQRATEIAPALLMEGYKWELRCYGLSMEQITKLAQCDFTEIYCTEIGTAKLPESPKHFVGKTVRIGDRVTRLLTPSEVFEVTTTLAADGTFFTKSVLNGDRQLFSLDDVNVLSSLPESAPKYATVLLPGDEHFGQKFEIVSQSNSGFGTAGYTLRTPSGDYWYSADSIELHDEAIEAIANPTGPAQCIQVGDRVKLSVPCDEPHRKFEDIEMEVVRFVGADLVNCLLPSGDWHPFPLSALCLASVERQEPAPDTHSILGVGDIVQVLSDRFPQFAGHTCTVAEITNAMPPILVRGSRGTKPYHRADLKLISKALPFPAEEKKELVAVGETDSADDF